MQNLSHNDNMREVLYLQWVTHNSEVV